MKQDGPTPRDFETYLGCTMRFGSTMLELTQLDVRTETSFSLVLRGPRAPILPEGLYEAELAGRDLGNLYVSPIHTPDVMRQDYQIVFNK